MKKTTVVIKQTYSNGKIFICCDFGDGQNPFYMSMPSNPAFFADVKDGKFSVQREVLCRLEGRDATKENTVAKKLEFIKKFDSCNPKVGYNMSGGGAKVKDIEKVEEKVVQVEREEVKHKAHIAKKKTKVLAAA